MFILHQLGPRAGWQYWTHGELFRMVPHIFKLVDVSRRGELSWNPREIPTFINYVFRHVKGMTPPCENAVYDLYRLFDVDGSNTLDEQECMDLVDFVLRCTFWGHVDG